MMKVFFVLLLFWVVLGSPKEDVANFFWPSESAPWESVDAFYYPDRNNLTRVQKAQNVGSVEACRDLVYAWAAQNGDLGLHRGDYECGIGRLEDLGFATVYRVTVR